MSHVQKLAKGTKRYQARWTDPDGRERTKTFQKKSDADKHLTAMEHAKHSGTYVDPAAGKVTVGQMADEWLASKVNLTPTTRALYLSVLKTHVRKRWGTVPLSRVDHGAIQKWIAELVASGTSPAHVAKIKTVFSGVLALAVRTKRLPSNPADGVQLPRARVERRQYLTAAQVDTLADHAARLPAGRPKRATNANFAQYRIAVYMLAYCGLRWSEIAALKVKNVDLAKRRLQISEAVTEVNGGNLVWGTPKSHEARSVPVSPFLATMLAEQIAGKSPDALVFTSPDGGVMRNRNARRAWFNRAAAETGLSGFTPHELRHTAASLAISAGASPHAVQRMLGHATASLTLDRYADLFEDDLDDVADRMDALRQRPRKNDKETT